MMISPCLYEMTLFICRYPCAYYTFNSWHLRKVLDFIFGCQTWHCGWDMRPGKPQLTASGLGFSLGSVGSVWIYLGQPLTVVCPASVALSGCVCFSFQVVTFVEKGMQHPIICAENIFRYLPCSSTGLSPAENQMSKPWCFNSEPRRGC